MTGKITRTDVIPFILNYCSKTGNSIGGNLHIVIDDGNIKNHHIAWCFEECRKAGDLDGMDLCEMLYAMSETQRKSIVGVWYDR